MLTVLDDLDVKEPEVRNEVVNGEIVDALDEMVFVELSTVELFENWEEIELVELVDTNVELSTVVLLTEFIDDVEVETGTDVLVSLVKLTGGWLEDVDVALLVVVIDVSVEKSDEALVEVSVEELV